MKLARVAPRAGIAKAGLTLALLALLTSISWADTWQVSCPINTGAGGSIFPSASATGFTGTAYDVNGNLKSYYGTSRKAITILNGTATGVFVCDAANNTNAASACSGCSTTTGMALPANAGLTDTFGHGNICCISSGAAVNVGVMLR